MTSTLFHEDPLYSSGFAKFSLLFLQEIGKLEANSPHTSLRKDLLSAQQYLDQHFKGKLNLEQIAEQFFMNKYYLSHTFKENFGFTVVEYIQYKRVNLAKQLLRFSELTVEKVARDCGIENANYFSRTFRKIEGIPPAKYLKLWQN